MTALRILIAEARLVIPDEIEQLPHTAAAIALAMFALAIAWVMLP